MSESFALSKARETSEIIAAALHRFTEDTDLTVTRVNVDPVFKNGKREPVAYQVSINARL